MSETLSIQEARKLVLLSHNLPPSPQKGKAIDCTLSSIENLGYIQIDTISTVQRAHHHTLWSRSPQYQNSHLDVLVAKKKVFEYWSHAAAYLPMRDYKYSLYRKNALLRGEQKHWFSKDIALMNAVMNRIAKEGPLMARDFVHQGKLKEWGSKPAKQALEVLFMQGDLMISSRKNFHKVYDLTERVLPDGIDRSEPTIEEYLRFLIKSYLRANGIGQAAEISYLLKNIKGLVTAALKEMYSSGELILITVNENGYYAFPESLALLNKPFNRSKLKILSPFDNLLIQRKRIQTLFDFNYQIECYTPEHKRKYGYFSLPILWNAKLVARMDCKADRKTSILHINHLAMEEGVKYRDAFFLAFCKELKAFMQFNNCTEIQVHKTSPSEFKAILQGNFVGWI